MQELRRQSRHDWLKPECYGRSHPSDVTCSGPPSKFCGLKPSPRGAVYLYANRGKAIPFFGLIRRKNVIRLGWRHGVRHSIGDGQGSGPGSLTVSGLLRPFNHPPGSLLVKSKREAALLGAAVFCSEPVFKHLDESFAGRKRRAQRSLLGIQADAALLTEFAAVAGSEKTKRLGKALFLRGRRLVFWSVSQAELVVAVAEVKVHVPESLHSVLHADIDGRKTLTYLFFQLVLRSSEEGQPPDCLIGASHVQNDADGDFEIWARVPGVDDIVHVLPMDESIEYLE